jgi:hypothetical protein
VAKLRYALLRRLTAGDVVEVVEALLVKAKTGDVAAARELLNRAVGKAVAPVELSGPGGEALAAGVSAADVQIVIVQALKDMPEARQKVAQALRELHDQHRATLDRPQP